MSQSSPKFLFDECLGKPAMAALAKVVPGVHHFEHIKDKFYQGILDEVWVPQLANEGGWIVITSDGGKQSGTGAKLPNVCSEYSVTHIVLSQKLHRKKSHEKIGAIALAWNDIKAAANEADGTRFHLRFRSVKGSASDCRIQSWLWLALIIFGSRYRPTPLPM